MIQRQRQKTEGFDRDYSYTHHSKLIDSFRSNVQQLSTTSMNKTNILMKKSKRQFNSINKLNQSQNYGDQVQIDQKQISTKNNLFFTFKQKYQFKNHKLTNVKESPKQDDILKQLSKNLFNTQVSYPFQNTDTKKLIKIKLSHSKNQQKIKNNPLLTASKRASHSSLSVSQQKNIKQIKLMNTTCKKLQMNNVQIYHFSPQKTSKQSNSKNMQSANIKQVNLKQNHKHNHSVGSNSSSYLPYKIKLQFPERDWLINQEDYKIQRKTDHPNMNKRWKTQYIEDKNDSYNHQFKLQKPQSEVQQQKQRKKIYLRRNDQDQSTKKKIMLRIQQNRDDMPKDQKNNQIRHKQMKEVETFKAKRQNFISKVKKYKFVQKYLTRQQINQIFEQMYASSMPQSKWPLAVIDRVYHKTKAINDQK